MNIIINVRYILTSYEGGITITINLNKLKSLRKQSNKTLEDIAKLLHVNTNTYFYKETGRIRLTLEEAGILANYFNVSIDELFFTN